MTVIKVGANEAYRTIGAAVNAASSGDTIEVYPGTYKEIVKIDKALTVVGIDEPVIDGGWDRKRKGDLYKPTVGINAADVVFSGFRIQNCPGTGMVVTGDAARVRVLDCEIDTTYGTGINVRGDRKARVSTIEIGRCRVLNTSMAMTLTGEQKAGNAVMLRDCEDVWFHHCVVARSYKEGINVDKGGLRTVVEDCILFDINHSAIYLNRAADCDIRRNIVYHTKARPFLGAAYDKRTSPTGIKVGDEGKTSPYPRSFNQRVMGNIVIGGSSCLTVANNPNNYDTQLNGAVISGNTFIGEVWQDEKGTSKTGTVIEIFQNYNGNAHKDSLFADNLIYAPAGVELSKMSGVGGVTFENNYWYSADGGNEQPDPRLVNPVAVVGDSFDLDNYRPQVGSPLVAAGIGALDPVQVEPPPPDPEPGPDISWLLPALEANLILLEEAGLRIGAAVVDTHEFIALLKAQVNIDPNG